MACYPLSFLGAVRFRVDGRFFVRKGFFGAIEQNKGWLEKMGKKYVKKWNF